MEVVIYAGLSTIWWMSSMSILLPFVLLLKYNKSFRNKWFAWIFVKICGPAFEKKMTPLRKGAFVLLNDALSERDKSVPLKVLEIGIGSGANLQFYPENSELIALDMNTSFEEYFRQNQRKYPQVTYERTVHCMAENMQKGVEDCSVDLVISTYVLCSVTDINAVLNEVIRVLKPDGKFLFLEHVQFPSLEWGSLIQSFTSPLWRLYFDGCCLNRRIDEDIKNAKFSNVKLNRQYPASLNMFIRPHVSGIATK
ncbi:putative methyltransferase-like protein 7A [Uloborus diversus]|uniref:putative methyltransferase-like protein 7A n=1 Tax=Uloborus diversus TaxID=327109 RepID=UPI002409F684|nr:putative methyltransferase-like protein 7A [Uloborus diversus]